MQKTKQYPFQKQWFEWNGIEREKEGKIWRRKQEYWLVSPFFSIVMFSENEREGMQEREYLPIFVFIYFYSSKFIFCIFFIYFSLLSIEYLLQELIIIDLL